MKKNKRTLILLILLTIAGCGGNTPIHTYGGADVPPVYKGGR